MSNNPAKRIMRARERQEAKEQEKAERERTEKVTPIVKEMFKIFAKYADEMMFAEDFAKKPDLMNALCNSIGSDIISFMRESDLPVNQINYVFQCFLQIPGHVKMKVEGGAEDGIDALVAYMFGQEGLPKEMDDLTFKDLDAKAKEYRDKDPEYIKRKAEKEAAEAKAKADAEAPVESTETVPLASTEETPVEPVAEDKTPE